MLYNLYLLSVLFHLHPYMERFYRKLFTLVSFISCVPQKNDNTAEQFNTTVLAENYISFFVAPHACPLLRLTIKCCVVW